MTTYLCLSPAPAVDVTYLVDGLVPGRVHRPLRVVRRAGGKAFNVARALTALGRRATVLGPVGGSSGRWLVEAAAVDGLDFAPTWLDGVETRTCVSVCCTDGTPPTDVYEASAPIGEEAWRALAAAVRARGAGTGVTTVLSGSLPPDGEARHLAALTEAARPGRVVVDMHGPVVAGWLGEADLDVVKVNLAEAADLLGRRAPDADETEGAHGLAADLLDRSRAALVVVTLGSHGAVARASSAAARVGPPPFGPFPVGSGDVFLAGLLHGLGDDWTALDGARLRDALRLAAAAGAVNARELGAGAVDPARVAAAAAGIEVEEPG